MQINSDDSQSDWTGNFNSVEEALAALDGLPASLFSMKTRTAARITSLSSVSKFGSIEPITSLQAFKRCSVAGG